MRGVNLGEFSAIYEFVDFILCHDLKIFGCDLQICRAIEGDHRIGQIPFRVAVQSLPDLLPPQVHSACDGIGKDLVGSSLIQPLCLGLTLIGSQYGLAIVRHRLLKDIDIGFTLLIVLGEIFYRDFPVIVAFPLRHIGICNRILCPHRILVIRIFFIGCQFLHCSFRTFFLIIS